MIFNIRAIIRMLGLPETRTYQYFGGDENALKEYEKKAVDDLIKDKSIELKEGNKKRE